MYLPTEDVIACQVSKIKRSGSFSKLKGKELIAEAINLNLELWRSWNTTTLPGSASHQGIGWECLRRHKNHSTRFWGRKLMISDDLYTWSQLSRKESEKLACLYARHEKPVTGHTLANHFAETANTCLSLCISHRLHSIELLRLSCCSRQVYTNRSYKMKGFKLDALFCKVVQKKIPLLTQQVSKNNERKKAEKNCALSSAVALWIKQLLPLAKWKLCQRRLLPGGSAKAAKAWRMCQ